MEVLPDRGDAMLHIYLDYPVTQWFLRHVDEVSTSKPRINSPCQILVAGCGMLHSWCLRGCFPASKLKLNGHQGFSLQSTRPSSRK